MKSEAIAAIPVSASKDQGEPEDPAAVKTRSNSASASSRRGGRLVIAIRPSSRWAPGIESPAGYARKETIHHLLRGHRVPLDLETVPGDPQGRVIGEPTPGHGVQDGFEIAERLTVAPSRIELLRTPKPSFGGTFELGIGFRLGGKRRRNRKPDQSRKPCHASGHEGETVSLLGANPRQRTRLPVACHGRSGSPPTRRRRRRGADRCSPASAPRRPRRESGAGGRSPGRLPAARGVSRRWARAAPESRSRPPSRSAATAVSSA